MAKNTARHQERRRQQKFKKLARSIEHHASKKSSKHHHKAKRLSAASVGQGKASKSDIHIAASFFRHHNKQKGSKNQDRIVGHQKQIASYIA